MKILYVEDQLPENIPKIIYLFSGLLENGIVEKLNLLDNDESGYGAGTQEIKETVESSGVIEVASNFSDALNKVISNYQEYSLFIIDRNLSSEDYSTDSIQSIDKDFDNTLSKKYFEREGDYLLHKLIPKGINLNTQFYFLTAYSSSELRNTEEVYGLIERKSFQKNNIIEKGNSDQTRQLINKINNIEIVNLQLDNKKYIEILRKKIGDKTPYNFIMLLKEKDSADEVQIANNLGNLRKILENILATIAKEKGAPEDCFEAKNKQQIIMGRIIYWIAEDENDQFDSNSIIKNWLYDIKQICSDFGAHSNSNISGFQPTRDTVNSLVYSLKDIIVWFAKIVD